MGMEDIKMI